jgi:hypothetical protein
MYMYFFKTAKVTSCEGTLAVHVRLRNELCRDIKSVKQVKATTAVVEVKTHAVTFQHNSTAPCKTHFSRYTCSHTHLSEPCNACLSLCRHTSKQNRYSETDSHTHPLYLHTDSNNPGKHTRLRMPNTPITLPPQIKHHKVLF